MSASSQGPVRVMGVMSGSSLDGIDLACCTFEEIDRKWHYRILAGRTVAYDPALRERLLVASRSTGLELARLHRDVGDAIGHAVTAFLPDAPAELVSSHGHTIFHQPSESLTTQVGCGARIAALGGLPVVCDLRSKDVALGGQGAPLVPLGERLLFPGHQAFLNLGGISNLSIHGSTTLGYDIGICNQALDHLAAEAGMPYDANGDLARTGRVDETLLQALNDLPFHAQSPPRSLGREWSEAEVLPLISGPGISLRDRMRTVVEHIAFQVGRELDRHGTSDVLVTGGGAHHGLLMERIAACTRARVERPERELIDQKEALIFALLGLLRWQGRPTALASVTGALRDSVGGAVYLPN